MKIVLTRGDISEKKEAIENNLMRDKEFVAFLEGQFIPVLKKKISADTKSLEVLNGLLELNLEEYSPVTENPKENELMRKVAETGLQTLLAMKECNDIAERYNIRRKEFETYK